MARQINTHSKSLLDVALDNYDIQAKRYFEAKNSFEKASVDVQEKRLQQLQNIQRHLESQRMNAFAIASIQGKLTEYRAKGREALEGTRVEIAEKQRELFNEKHHYPSGILPKLMKAACKPQPCSRHTAHHIVPGKGFTERAEQTRVHLHMHGIRINDPDNGVWLPKTKKDTPLWSMPNALGHKQYHTHKYEAEVAKRIVIQYSEIQIRIQLNLIEKLLLSNQFPTHPEA